jgi:integrase
LLKVVADALQEHRKTSTSEWVFAGQTGRPLVIANMTRREVIPRLKEAGIVWRGWHAFRRGLASNLHELGVQDKTIQEILRHSNVAVTQALYIKVASTQATDAMQELAAAFRRVKKTVKEKHGTRKRSSTLNHIQTHRK